MSFLLLVGSSGSGKSTLAALALENLPNASLVTSTTTRKRRPSDLPGEYSYVSWEMFDKLSKRKGVFLDVFNHSDEFYATRVDEILKSHYSSGQHTRIAILVPKAVPRWLELLKERGNTELRGVYVLYVETEVSRLRSRLERRGDDPNTIDRKIAESACFKQDLSKIVPSMLISTIHNNGSVEQFKRNALNLLAKLDL